MRFPGWVHIRYPGGTRAHDQQLAFLVLRSIIMDFVGVGDGKATRRLWHRRAMISGWAPARPPRAFKHQDLECFLVKVRLALIRSQESRVGKADGITCSPGVWRDT